MKEAKIVCDPVTSLYALKPSDNKRTKMLKNRRPVAKVFPTSAGENNSATVSFTESSLKHKVTGFMSIVSL